MVAMLGIGLDELFEQRIVYSFVQNLLVRERLNEPVFSLAVTVLDGHLLRDTLRYRIDPSTDEYLVVSALLLDEVEPRKDPLSQDRDALYETFLPRFERAISRREE